MTRGERERTEKKRQNSGVLGLIFTIAGRTFFLEPLQYAFHNWHSGVD
jgi:hypothetical protein